MRDQLDGMKKENENMRNRRVQELYNLQNSTMANLESSLLYKLVIELGKIQTDLSAKFNSLTPIFKQI
jgi:hypothetical protein